MTAINVSVRDDAVHLYVDALGTRLIDGSEAGIIVQKAIPLPLQRAVIAARGVVDFLPLLYGHSLQLSTFNMMAEHLPEVAQMTWKVLDDKFGAGVGRDLGGVEIVLAGWPDDGEAPTAYFMSSIDRREGPAPWKMVEIQALASPPTNVSPHRFPYLDVERDGVRLMDLQRGAHDEPIGRVHVGGACQLTSVYRNRIESRVLARWPDDVGEALAA